MLKILPKMLSGISQNFHLLCSSVFGCVPIMLALCFKVSNICYNSWDILIRECSIRVFHYKVTVLLESIDLFSWN